MKNVEEVLAAPVGKCSMPNRDQGALVLSRAVCLFVELCSFATPVTISVLGMVVPFQDQGFLF